MTLRGNQRTEEPPKEKIERETELVALPTVCGGQEYRPHPFDKDLVAQFAPAWALNPSPKWPVIGRSATYSVPSASCATGISSPWKSTRRSR